MKALAFTLGLILASSCLAPISAQSLPQPVVSSVPCALAAGQTETLSWLPVTGADGYQIQMSGPQLNAILIDGLISPVSNFATQVNLTGILPQEAYEVCIRAFSACCTSSYTCVSVPGRNQIAFPPSNLQVVSQGSVHSYSIALTCPAGSGAPAGPIQWTISGDAAFSNGQNSISTPYNNFATDIHFGNMFGSGNLCVSYHDGFGNTISKCMGIFNTNYTPD